MSTVTTVTKKQPKPVRFAAALGQLRTLKNGKLTVTLTAEPAEIKKILELVTACQTGNALALSAQVIHPKKDAKKKPDTQKQKGSRRVQRYPYK
jgi:hypothetical protein